MVYKGLMIILDFWSGVLCSVCALEGVLGYETRCTEIWWNSTRADFQKQFRKRDEELTIEISLLCYFCCGHHSESSLHICKNMEKLFRTKRKLNVSGVVLFCFVSCRRGTNLSYLLQYVKLEPNLCLLSLHCVYSMIFQYFSVWLTILPWFLWFSINWAVTPKCTSEPLLFGELRTSHP